MTLNLDLRLFRNTKHLFSFYKTAILLCENIFMIVQSRMNLFLITKDIEGLMILFYIIIKYEQRPRNQTKSVLTVQSNGGQIAAREPHVALLAE